jgi:hypothetical protein
VADLTDRDRGQIILIAAFALAVTFVALAVVVNSAIFTENLASRGETGGSDDALSLRYDVEQGVGRSIESANVYNTTSQSTLEEGVEKGIGNVNAAFSKQNAAHTAIVNVSHTGSPTYGSRVVQNESGGRTFESNTGDSNWVVMYGVKRVTPSSEPGNGTRAFEMNLSEVPDPTLTPFTVTVYNYTADDGSAETWEMKIWGSTTNIVAGTDLTVEVSKSSTGTTESCTVEVDRNYATIDVTGGTVAGQHCEALRGGEFDGRFASGVGRKYNITYTNGNAVTGNYSMVTANHSAATMDAPNLNDNTDGNDPRGSPYVTEAIYDLDVDFIYKSPKLDYETQIRVAPGEPR